jgi:hypothetical protein
LQHVSNHMRHNQANLEPLNILEFLLTVLFVSKAADRCETSRAPPAGPPLPLPTQRTPAYETKRTVNKNSKMFSGSKLA